MYVALCGDGNCCFRAGSLLLWPTLLGDKDHYAELRVQTIIVLDRHIYLADCDGNLVMEAQFRLIRVFFGLTRVIFKLTEVLLWRTEVKFQTNHILIQG